MVVRARVQSGTFSDDTVGGLSVQRVDWLTAAGMRKVTVQGYRSALRPLVVLLGDMKVIDVRTSDVQRFVSWVLREGSTTGKPLSPRSVKYALTAASQLFGRAVTGDVIAQNPVKPDVYRRKTKATAKRSGADFWARPQVDAFRAVADADPPGAALRLTLAGMTRSEVHGLTWECVDLDAGTITIRQGRVALAGKPEDGQDHSCAVDAPKTDQRWRTHPVETFEPGTLAALRSLKAAQAADRLRAGSAWTDSGFVVVDAVRRPEGPERYSERFRKLAAEANLPAIRLHALRHSLVRRDRCAAVGGRGLVRAHHGGVPRDILPGAWRGGHPRRDGTG